MANDLAAAPAWKDVIFCGHARPQAALGLAYVTMTLSGPGGVQQKSRGSNQAWRPAGKRGDGHESRGRVLFPLGSKGELPTSARARGPFARPIPDKKTYSWGRARPGELRHIEQGSSFIGQIQPHETAGPADRVSREKLRPGHHNCSKRQDTAAEGQAWRATKQETWIARSTTFSREGHHGRSSSVKAPESEAKRAVELKAEFEAV